MKKTHLAISIALILIVLAAVILFSFPKEQEPLPPSNGTGELSIQSAQDAENVIESIEADLNSSLKMFEGMKKSFEEK